MYITCSVWKAPRGPPFPLEEALLEKLEEDLREGRSRASWGPRRTRCWSYPFHCCSSCCQEQNKGGLGSGKDQRLLLCRFCRVGSGLGSRFSQVCAAQRWLLVYKAHEIKIQCIRLSSVYHSVSSININHHEPFGPRCTLWWTNIAMENHHFYIMGKSTHNGHFQ